MKRILVSLVVVAALALPLSAPAGSTATRIGGTTADPMVITLTKAGKRVTSLKRGAYTITVRDRSRNHDYWIVGPGMKAKMITGLAFVGTKTVNVTFRRAGRYEFYCLPHRRAGMKGFFRVT